MFLKINKEMLRLINKIGAIWCIITSREYMAFTCNKFDNAKNSKCWVSMGVDEKHPNSNIFLEASQELIDIYETQ